MQQSPEFWVPFSSAHWVSSPSISLSLRPQDAQRRCPSGQSHLLTAALLCCKGKDVKSLDIRARVAASFHFSVALILLFLNFQQWLNQNHAEMHWAPLQGHVLKSKMSWCVVEVHFTVTTPTLGRASFTVKGLSTLHGGAGSFPLSFSIHFLLVSGDTGQVASLSRGTPSLTRRGNLDALIILMCLDPRGKPGHLQKTHRGGFKPTTFLLWGPSETGRLFYAFIFMFLYLWADRGARSALWDCWCLKKKEVYFSPYNFLPLGFTFPKISED